MPLILCAADWSSGPVQVALRFPQRWRGLRPRPAGFGLLLRTRSVHAIGMKEGLWLAGISEEGVVVAVRHLRPNAIARFSAARWVLELPDDRVPPVPGAVLSWAGGGQPDPVRIPDWQPGRRLSPAPEDPGRG
ncbi:MAG TPA: hypothetical protein VID03_11730 [Acidimicrobiia bacterium]